MKEELLRYQEQTQEKNNNYDTKINEKVKILEKVINKACENNKEKKIITKIKR